MSARFVNRFGVKPILISGMALQTIGYLFLSPISLIESYFGGLLVPMLVIASGTGLGFTAINIAALTGTRRGEGIASGLINTSRQIGGPIGLAVLLTVANFETSAETGHVVQSAAAMVTGFAYAFLGAALEHGTISFGRYGLTRNLGASPSFVLTSNPASISGRFRDPKKIDYNEIPFIGALIDRVDLIFIVSIDRTNKDRAINYALDWRGSWIIITQSRRKKIRTLNF